MVLESAGYYQKLYLVVGLSASMGWYTAILSEAFQLTLVMVLPTRTESQWFKYLLLGLISLIYLISVLAAGMNVGKPLIVRWSQMEQKQKLFNILESEQQSLQNDVNLFHQQNQKRNTAIIVKAKRQSYQEIKDHLKKEQPLDSLLIQIELIALWCLRVIIQLANLCCARLIATLWNLGTKPSPDPRSKKQSQTVAPGVIRKWKARYTRDDKGFVGIVELSNGSFLSITPKWKKSYKTFQGALKSLEETPYGNKITRTPTWEKAPS
ncbi:MAG: hypothetical protein HQ517_04880 [SAR324 cluster bacterium]|nr:hypothetical protein [SAR324 cluster bacterium]